MGKRYLGDLFISGHWYLLMGTCALFFLVTFFLPFLLPFALLYFLLATIATATDYSLLFLSKYAVRASREVPVRMNLGDENEIRINLYSTYPFHVHVNIIDELPIQLQNRDFGLTLSLTSGEPTGSSYLLKPYTRGVYTFGRLLCYVSSPLRLVQRRFSNATGHAVKVYPSIKYLRQYQLLALSDNTHFAGIKKTRSIGHSLEFEQIKEYVKGDDLRSINWKATARKGSLMVNNYIDTRSQQVYCLIDKGRSMKMPFDGMSLLDHAINATLAFLNVALLKQDRAGLITFGAKLNDLLPARGASTQLHHINELLYRQTTQFEESNLEVLAASVFRKITQRSFLLLFTNFETMASLERQLPYLRKLASRHLLCVVFFSNTLLKEIHEEHPDSIEGIYIKTIADRFDFEKKQIVKELRRYGIIALLSTPKELTVAIINKYLELKARQLL